MENGKQPINPIPNAVSYDNENKKFVNAGLTKREYFAAKAMQGYCGGEYTGQSGMPHEQIAAWSVNMADALLKQLEITTPPSGE